MFIKMSSNVAASEVVNCDSFTEYNTKQMNTKTKSKKVILYRNIYALFTCSRVLCRFATL